MQTDVEQSNVLSFPEQLETYEEQGRNIRISAHRVPNSSLVNHHSNHEWLKRQAFEIGWDFARYGLHPEGASDSVWDGYRGGYSHFGMGRCLKHDPFVRKWLRLRISANRRGRIFDESVTPTLLSRVAVKYCPITREELIYPDHLGGDTLGSVCGDNIWTVDRLNNQAGYIEGNILVMSQLANAAKDRFGFDESREMALAAERERDGLLRGLNSAQWGRVASLCLLVDNRTIPEEAAYFPMLCVVPPGVHMRHPPLVVQYQLMRAIGTSGHDNGKAIAHWISVFPSKKARVQAAEFIKTFGQVFYMSGKPSNWSGNPTWALEDVWVKPGVWSAWKRLVRNLTMDEMQVMARASRVVEKDLGNWSERAGIGSLGYSCDTEEDDLGPVSERQRFAA